MKQSLEQIEKLIDIFKQELTQKGFDRIRECLEYPGGICIIERNNLRDRNMDDANAFTERAKVHVLEKESEYPHWTIHLIKDEVEKMADEDILHTLAHESSHILTSPASRQYPDINILQEQACDILAEHYFGFPKKDKEQGYIR